MEVTKDGRNWQIGMPADVAWIASWASIGITIATAIPPVFEAYATFDNVGEAAPISVQETAVVQRLAARSGDQSWWLGFLETGAHDIVFDEAPRVTLYSDWHYVLVRAGPSQALTWRTGHTRELYGVLPDLFFFPPTGPVWFPGSGTTPGPASVGRVS